jgi:hypothetical protein
MRKIENDMLMAIAGRRNWKSGNTEVRWNPKLGDKYSSVYLFGNHIADVYYGYYGNLKVWVNVDTLREWSTRTTKSRLRALKVDITTRKGLTTLTDGRGFEICV